MRVRVCVYMRKGSVLSSLCSSIYIYIYIYSILCDQIYIVLICMPLKTSLVEVCNVGDSAEGLGKERHNAAQ